MSLSRSKRQIPYHDYRDDGDSRYWWYSPTAVAVKWSVIAGIVLIFVGWFVGGYLHARRRIRKGLPLLAYHRFLVPRFQRAQSEQHQFAQRQNFSFYQARGDEQGPGYGMHAYPPPAYNPNYAPPPAYQPPPGASKTAFNQHTPNEMTPPFGESSTTNQGRAVDPNPVMPGQRSG